MTDYSHFEKLVAENKNLNILINDQKYGAILTIRRAEWMTPYFIDWISPKYFSAFENIYKNNYNDNIGAVCGVIRENFLANDETKEKLVEFLMLELDHSIDSLEIFLKEVSESKYKSIEYLNELASGLAILTLTILKNVETEFLLEKKKNIQDYYSL